MIFPRGLNIGDTVGIIAPAGSIEVEKISDVKKAFNSLGYNVEFGQSCFETYNGYLAGSDDLRVKDIHSMFLNYSIKGIICMRGGYGSTRILDMINYDIVKNNPKFFVGFSDITALNIAFNQLCELVTFHGIMALTSPSWDKFTYDSLLSCINMGEKLNVKNPFDEQFKTLIDGTAQGELTGGNLSLIASTIGTKYEINTKDKIIFIEEVNEPTYKIDRMLTHLIMAGKFDDCSGIIFGDFKDCKKQSDGDLELEELFQDRIFKYRKPCIYNIRSGHCIPMITLPMGVNCVLDSNNKKIEFFR